MRTRTNLFVKQRKVETLVWKRLSNEYKIKLKVLQWVESNRKPILFEKLASGFGKLGRVCFDQNLISCEVLREGNGQLQGLVAGWGGCEGRGGRRRGCWILLEDSSTNNMCVSLFHGFPRTWQWRIMTMVKHWFIIIVTDSVTGVSKLVRFLNPLAFAILDFQVRRGPCLVQKCFFVAFSQLPFGWRTIFIISNQTCVSMPCPYLIFVT